jgi:hypothetical protein
MADLATQQRKAEDNARSPNDSGSAKARGAPSLQRDVRLPMIGMPRSHTSPYLTSSLFTMTWRSPSLTESDGLENDRPGTLTERTWWPWAKPNGPELRSSGKVAVPEARCDRGIVDANPMRLSLSLVPRPDSSSALRMHTQNSRQIPVR